jgi:hypothetical protein
MISLQWCGRNFVQAAVAALSQAFGSLQVVVWHQLMIYAEKASISGKKT